MALRKRPTTFRSDRRFDRQLRLGGWVSLIGIMAVNAMGFLDHDTHSGLGCGANWPLCHGALVPTFSNEAVMIEYVHRLLTLGFVVVVGWFLIRAALRRDMPKLWTRMAQSLIALVLVESTICTAGVLWATPNALMAFLAPIGLAAQSLVLLLLIWPQSTDPTVNRRAARPTIQVTLVLMALYLYLGAWRSYGPSHFPNATAVHAMGGLVALSALWWGLQEFRAYHRLSYSVWPLMLAPLLANLSRPSLLEDMAIYFWVSWCTGALAYQWLGLKGHAQSEPLRVNRSQTAANDRA